MDSYRVPWNFDEESVDVLRHFTRLKNRLMPYLYGAAREASRIGVPMLRAMFLEFPDDPGTFWLDQQYMLGDALLVAPVFNAEGVVDVYLPPGRWTHLLSGVEKTGGWHRERHDAFSLPLYVRENTLLAVGGRDDRASYDHADGVTLELYALADGATATRTVTGSDGRELIVTARRTGMEIVVAASGNAPWRLLVVGKRVRADSEATEGERGTTISGQPSMRLVLATG